MLDCPLHEGRGESRSTKGSMKPCGFFEGNGASKRPSSIFQCSASLATAFALSISAGA